MAEESLTIALVGNPNTGKSTVFNGLTGLRQKIANYPGVTVERKVGFTTIDEQSYKVIDLPGTYSLNYKKIDERITYQTLIGEYEHEEAPDVVMIVADSSNLDRNLFLATQVMDLGLPCMLVLNMQDVADDKGINIDPASIEDTLGIPVLAVSAKYKKDIEKLKEAISAKRYSIPEALRWTPGKNLRIAIDVVIDKWIKPFSSLPERAHIIEALRLISDNHLSEAFYEYENEDFGQKVVDEARFLIENEGGNPIAAEVLFRYDFINECTRDSVRQEDEDRKSISDRIDEIVTHKVFGPVIFLLVLLVMFQSIFTWATPFMDMIDLVFVETGNWLASNLPSGVLTSLLVDGVVAGLGGVVIFLPQILFLFLFIYVLEGTGYMARAAFVMDGFMTKVGLHGRSVVPLMSGFACAIPGIMATRNIENWRDRIITIMVLPFMACSARLPVYALLIAAFIPDDRVFWFIDLQGITFFGLYLFGIVMAILAAIVMNQFFAKTESSPFIMELPSYKMPKWSVVFQNTFERGKVFVTEAGKIIIAISIVLWFLASYPKVDIPDSVITDTTTTESSFNPQDDPDAYQLKNSYAGKFGNFIEPAIEPLGFDWKIGIGLITSFAAREVMVGTLNTIYSIQESGDEVVTLKQKLINDKNLETGQPVYSTATAISLMIFFALAMQCMSTIAIVRRETNSWKWPAAMFFYMTTLAYLCSLAAYQIGSNL
ncbi:ferrous iron transport protein B [Balneola sp. MJW-20]|uniref:ferrous iron transport protein B n=1 Tax=Gracilimonas aurantiaca TaxID=3234185 RepID=UPI0034658600